MKGASELKLVDRDSEAAQWLDDSPRKEMALRYVFRSSGWTATEKLLAAAIISWVDEDGMLECSVGQLVEWTATSRSTMRRTLQTLTTTQGPLRFCRFRRRSPGTGRTTTNVYAVTWKGVDG